MGSSCFDLVADPGEIAVELHLHEQSRRPDRSGRTLQVVLTVKIDRIRSPATVAVIRTFE